MKSFRTIAFGIAAVAASGLMTPFSAASANPRWSPQRSRQSRSVQPRQIERGFQTVEVTGTGETLEKAQNNAKMNALTTVAGMALKSKVKVLDDGMQTKLSEEHIAASAGLIGSYENLETKRKNGLFTVKAKVTVYSEKLLETVIFEQDGTSKPGTVDIGSDIESIREDMTRYLVSYMLDYCRIWSISAREIIPDYDKTGRPVLHVNFYWGTTPERYGMYLQRLRRALLKVGAKETTERMRGYYPLKIVVDPSEKSNEGGDPPGSRGWTYFWLPDKYLEAERVFDDELGKYGYKMTVELLDAGGTVIRTRELFCTFYGYNGNPEPRVRYGFLMGPLPGNHQLSAYKRKFHIDFTGFSGSAEMLKVKKVRAKVGPVKKIREKGRAFPQFWGGQLRWGWVEH